MPRLAPQIIYHDNPKVPSSVNTELQSLVQQLNQALLVLNSRIESTLTRDTRLTPPIVANFTAQGRTPGFWLTWAAVNPQLADGYVILMARDSLMTQVDGRFPVNDVHAISQYISIGNVTATRYFQIFAKNGDLFGQPTVARSATSTANGVAESAPTSPPEYAETPPEPNIFQTGVL